MVEVGGENQYRCGVDGCSGCRVALKLLYIGVLRTLFVRANFNLTLMVCFHPITHILEQPPPLLF